MGALGTPGLPRFFRFLRNSSQAVVRGWAERKKSLGERGADLGKGEFKTLGFVSFIGYPYDLRKKLLFFFVCADPLEIVLLAKPEKHLIITFFLRIVAAVPGSVGRNISVVSFIHDIHLVSLKRDSYRKYVLRPHQASLCGGSIIKLNKNA